MPININTGGLDRKGLASAKATTILAAAVAIGLITLGFVAISWRAASCSTGQQPVYVPVRTVPQSTAIQSGSE